MALCYVQCNWGPDGQQPTLPVKCRSRGLVRPIQRWKLFRSAEANQAGPLATDIMSRCVPPHSTADALRGLDARGAPTRCIRALRISGLGCT